ncbi:uncharacterized protein LOC116040565 isoform X1 [Sander lucioperca]|uniref:uncharacterized protein LOC116040565 isoform X1 n=1 Tax=Sander lucioperca TaxID=283035 RepID=UPI001653875F|nr:uncharacterized protein LOC116040565 isoform X1 [Sander lucioperca]
MSCKQRRDKITLFLLVVTFYYYTFQVSHSVSLGQREEGLTAYQVQEATVTGWERIKHDNDAQQGHWRLVEQVIQAPNLRKSTQRGLTELRPESVAFPGEPIPYRAATLDDSLSWTVGNIRTESSNSASDSEDGYQADFTGFHGVQGEIMGPFDSSPHFSEWLAMRPLVQCDDSVMTFTTSGEGFTHLFVNREGASPISLFQLPPYCGYSVWTSWSDLQMMMPYDACYIKQENGRYVLSLLWWGSPLNLSCPVQMSTPVPSYSHSVPSVFCLPYGMAVQIHGHEQDIQILGVIVNGGWAAFVSEDCAYRVPSHPGELAFFISYGAPCITSGDDLPLHLKLDDQEYILSCPVNPQFPFVPSPPLSPGNLQFPYTPDPVSPAPTFPPFPRQTPSQEQIAQLPDYPHYPYPGFQYPQLSQFFYPGSQPDQPSWPTPGSPSGPQQQHSPIYPFSQFYPQTPIYFPPLPAKETFQTTPKEPQKPAASPATCPSDNHTICSYYPYPYYHYLHLPQYHPPYPPVPQYTETQPTMTTTPPTTTSSTASTTAGPTPQVPHLQCLMGKMVVFLPFAHPDSIQVRDQMMTWLFIPSVSPLCGYMLQMAEGSGVILHSPLPACHSQSRTPTTISLALRFWDLSMAQYRTLDLQCPYQTTPETPAPVTPSVSPTPPSTTKAKVSLSVVPKPKVFCTSHQMTVELPSGPISGIVVKDIKGNQMNLQDAPEHCGYSARKGKEGKIHLRLQLHSRCHMSVQGKTYIITVVYMTVSGGREAQLSCPVVVPGSGQECNLPSEQRLPCRPGSVSQPQCLSMGCCFSKHPPACYYPMDECTIDRHFVFSVPASLTEPPLSPALLVTAGDSTCKPQRVTSDYALFKIPMDGCGTRRVTVGKTVIYMVEVINKVQSISLNYGTITRDSPVRLLVECRFLPGDVLSVSYLVKTPTLGPEVQTKGMFGVQLRIAKDAQYSSFYPQHHQPLQMLLGKPLYLEVRLLNAPDPSLVLLVHFCVAYPRSGKAVWQLLYNGCPNPLDPALQQAVLSDPRPPSPRAQTRRFTISTFQFLPDSELKDPDEEIYFMCSTEICSPKDGPCVEGCFGQ